MPCACAPDAHYICYSNPISISVYVLSVQTLPWKIVNRTLSTTTTSENTLFSVCLCLCTIYARRNRTKKWKSPKIQWQWTTINANVSQQKKMSGDKDVNTSTVVKHFQTLQSSICCTGLDWKNEITSFSHVSERLQSIVVVIRWNFEPNICTTNFDSALLWRNMMLTNAIQLKIERKNYLQKFANLIRSQFAASKLKLAHSYTKNSFNWPIWPEKDCIRKRWLNSVESNQIKNDFDFYLLHPFSLLRFVIVIVSEKLFWFVFGC